MMLRIRLDRALNLVGREVKIPVQLIEGLPLKLLETLALRLTYETPLHSHTRLYDQVLVLEFLIHHMKPVGGLLFSHPIDEV